MPSTIIGAVLYFLLNACYTVAVFTDPGSPLTTTTAAMKTTRKGGYGGGGDGQQYSMLPITEPESLEYTTFTVSSTGGSRYCKKCECPKPDRAHHCSTCKRCVLKMDHHCPWLATCVGLYNYKPFLLFLMYTSLFCWVCFAVSASWLWNVIFYSSSTFVEDGVENILPVSVVLLSILAGIIGLVLTGFTAWHISLAVRGMTTIENLEKTRYVSPLQKALNQHRFGGRHGQVQSSSADGFGQRLQGYGNQILDAHANAIPGVTRAEEGVERPSPTAYPQRPSPTPYGGDDDYYNSNNSNNHAGTTQQNYRMDNLTPAQQSLSHSYADLERQRDHDRYNDYLDERDSEKLPNPFNLGWRRNLLHLFGDRPLFWFLPVCNTSGDGWHWEASKKFFEVREIIRERREIELANERRYHRELYRRHLYNGNTAWLGTAAAQQQQQQHHQHQPPSWTRTRSYFHDAERPDTAVSMKTLRPTSSRRNPEDIEQGQEDEDELYDGLDESNKLLKREDLYGR